MEKSITYEIVYDDGTVESITRKLDIYNEQLTENTILRLLIMKHHNDKNPKKNCVNIKNIKTV